MGPRCMWNEQNNGAMSIRTRTVYALTNNQCHVSITINDS